MEKIARVLGLIGRRPIADEATLRVNVGLGSKVNKKEDKKETEVDVRTAPRKLQLLHEEDDDGPYIEIDLFTSIDDNRGWEIGILSDSFTDNEVITAVLEPQHLPQVKTTAQQKWIYTFFRWCAERHKVYERRLNDPSLSRWDSSSDILMRTGVYGNVFRQLDRGSLYIKQEVLGKGIQTHEEMCFRLFLFCGFYLNTTYEAIVEGLGEPPSWRNFSLEKYEDLFIDALRRDPHRKLYTGAFQIVPPTQWFGKMPHFAATLRFVKALMEMGMPARLQKCVYAVDASAVLQSAPSLGGFLSLNILVNLNQSPHVSFKYRNFASCGPGSRKYLQAIFGRSTINTVRMEEAGLKWLYDNQWRYLARLGEDPPQCKGLRMGLRILDIENSLCWAWRYVAAATKPGAPHSMHTAKAPKIDWDAEATISMPAWCEEEKNVDHNSKVPFIDDPSEQKAKLPPLKRKRALPLVRGVPRLQGNGSQFAPSANEEVQEESDHESRPGSLHRGTSEGHDREGVESISGGPTRYEPPIKGLILADDNNAQRFEQKYDEVRGNNAGSTGEEETVTEDEFEEVYEVEKVIDLVQKRYRVRWKGYPPEDDTWELQDTLKQGAEEALSDFVRWRKRVAHTISRIRDEDKYRRRKRREDDLYNVMGKRKENQAGERRILRVHKAEGRGHYERVFKKTKSDIEPIV